MSLLAWFRRLPSQPLQTALIIFGLIWLVYATSFFNTFIWDDEQFIVRNIYTTSLGYLPEIFTTNTIAGAGETSDYYRPLTTLSFTLDRLIWGLRPFGFHLTNAVLHAGAGVALWYFLKKLGLGQWPALATALLFGLHPIQAESVAYINSRGDSLYAFWLLISLIGFLYLFDTKPWLISVGDRTWKISRPVMVGLTVGGFVAAVLSKEIAVAGLGIFPALWLIKMGQSSLLLAIKRSAAALALLVASVVSYLTLRLTILNFSNSLNFYGQETDYTRHLGIRLLTFTRVLWTYFQILLVPYPLHMERTSPIITSLASPWWLLIIGLGLAIVAAGYWEWRSQRSWWIWFGAWWFSCFLVPVSGIVPINGLIYEHWLYLPLIGFFLVLWGGLKLLVPTATKLRFSVLLLVVGTALVMYVILTLRQIWLWRAPIPFYSYTLQFAQTARLYNNLAMAYADAGQSDQAIAVYKQALEIEPMYPQIHYNLARSYLEIGEIEAAEAEFMTAKDISGGNFEFATIALIDLYRQEKNYSAALPLIEAMADQYPDDIQLLLTHGEALFSLDRSREAEIVWQRAYQRSGFNQQVLTVIGQLKGPAQPKQDQQPARLQTQ